MKDRIAIVDGVRTPFCKANGVFKDIEADDLGAYAVQELLARTAFPPDKVDELIFGNVLQPVNATNIARIVSVKGGLPVSVPAFTVNRNCASGMESVITAANKIKENHANVIIAGGTESMSNFPIVFPKKMKEFLMRLSKAKGWKQKLMAIFSLRPSFFKPILPEIGDPLCDLTMGQTAEIIAREFRVTREEADEFALLSQQRAAKAMQEGFFAEEIIPVPLPPDLHKFQVQDDGPRANQTMESLKSLKPVFDKVTGSVTAGNASQLTDGAAAVLLMTESQAKELGYTPLGYIKDYEYAAIEPNRMGMGPAYAIAKLINRTGMKLSDFDLIEINEAFAAQIVAVEKALASPEFARKVLNRDQPIGKIDRNRLNVNGGAVALGHPLGASGTRLILTLLRELKRRNQQTGLATLCIGGGQGEAIVVEVK